ncbi:MAG TPA: SDR family oxidoreductase [Pyrinomonadaceae bacterium]|nr:SDR family oxidoreductase [Pyrinomonadaceae bacterium]
MKLVIFGAAGKSGRQLVEQALEGEHEVTAFVRNPAALKLSHPKLKIFQGDALDAAAVSRAVAGQDAVMYAIGTNRRSTLTVCSESTRHIINAMKEHGVRRFVVLSAYGASETKDTALYSKVLRSFIGKRVEDKDRQEELVRASDLDWVLVRPPLLTNGARKGRYRVGFDIPIKLFSSVSRADVAKFMLRQLTEDKYLHQAPTITN